MGMCERRATLGPVSYRRVRERERSLCLLHSGVCQFEYGIHPEPAGRPRVTGSFRMINMVGPPVSERFG
jgi:hypothetical protein